MDLFERQYPSQNSSSSFDRPASPSGSRRLPDDLSFNEATFKKMMMEPRQDKSGGNSSNQAHESEIQFQSASLFQNHESAPTQNLQRNSLYINNSASFSNREEISASKNHSKKATSIGKTHIHPSSLSPTSKNLDRNLAYSSAPSSSVSETQESDYVYQDEQRLKQKAKPSTDTQHHHHSRKKKTPIAVIRKKDSKQHIVSSRGGKQSASSSSSEIKDIKSSLKEHFDAIKSLQTALSIGNNPLKAGSHSSNLDRASKPLEQTSKDIRQRIKMIEATLRDVGEPVSMSETNSDPARRTHHHGADSPLTSFQSLHSLRPPTAPAPATAHSSADVDRLNQRLDRMEQVMGDISNSLMVDRKRTVAAEAEAGVLKANSAEQQGNPTAAPLNTQTSEQITKLMSEIHKLRFDFKNQEKLNNELLAKNKALERKMEMLQGADNRDSRAQALGTEEAIDPKIQIFCKQLVQKHLMAIENTLQDKVDTAVLEELAHHIATKEELKKYVKKTSLNKIMMEYDLKTVGKYSDAKHDKEKEDILDKIKVKLGKVAGDVKKIESRLPSIFATSPEKQSELFIQGQLYDMESKMHKKLQDWVLEKIGAQAEVIEAANEEKIAIAKESVQTTVKALISDTVRKALEEAPTDFMNIDAESHPLIRKMVRDFDEKLYTVCSDLSACKQLFVNQSNQPFYRCAQWMWTSGSLKLGSAVPWNLQTSNTDPDNFKWDQDHFNIRIAEAGLYEINLAFFTKAKPSIQLVVNGESVLSAINSPSYVIQHSSGYVMDGNGKVEPGTITGISLVDFLALPSKSTLSIHYHGVKKNTPAHGFLGLKRM